MGCLRREVQYILQWVASFGTMQWLETRLKVALMLAETMEMVDGPLDGSVCKVEGHTDVRLVFLHDSREVLVYAREKESQAYRFRPHVSLLLTKDFDRVVAEYPGMTPLEIANAQPDGTQAA